MRDYAKLGRTWTDYLGRIWPVTTSVGRLKFKYPSHAAIRQHVFNRDGFKCFRCNANAVNVPSNYNGRLTLSTDTLTGTGRQDCLIVDHVLTLSAGGENNINNYQTLCETCNKKKIKQDVANTRLFIGGSV